MEGGLEPLDDLAVEAAFRTLGRLAKPFTESRRHAEQEPVRLVLRQSAATIAQLLCVDKQV
jgi:hypothetical protein